MESKSTKSFKCDKCKEKFSDKEKLKIHMQLKCRKYVVCERCEEKCKTIRLLNEHFEKKHCGKIPDGGQGQINLSTNSKGELVGNYIIIEENEITKADIAEHTADTKFMEIMAKKYLENEMEIIKKKNISKSDKKQCEENIQKIKEVLLMLKEISLLGKKG